MLGRDDTLQARLPATKKKIIIIQLPSEAVCFSACVRSATVNGSLYMEIRTTFVCLLVCFLAQLAPPTLDQRYLSLHLTESERQQAWDLCMVEMCFMPEGSLRVLLVSASQPGSSLQLLDHVYLSAAYPTLVDQVLCVCGTLPQERPAPTSLSTWTSATMCLGA